MVIWTKNSVTVLATSMSIIDHLWLIENFNVCAGSNNWELPVTLRWERRYLLSQSLLRHIWDFERKISWEMESAESLMTMIAAHLHDLGMALPYWTSLCWRPTITRRLFQSPGEIHQIFFTSSARFFRKVALGHTYLTNESYNSFLVELTQIIVYLLSVYRSILEPDSNPRVIRLSKNEYRLSAQCAPIELCPQSLPDVYGLFLWTRHGSSPENLLKRWELCLRTRLLYFWTSSPAFLWKNVTLSDLQYRWWCDGLLPALDDRSWQNSREFIATLVNRRSLFITFSRSQTNSLAWENWLRTLAFDPTLYCHS